jgi:hypothetical protein
MRSTSLGINVSISMFSLIINMLAYLGYMFMQNA